jgi:hypothetical protein
VTIDGTRANLRALDIPAGQFVELRTPRPAGPHLDRRDEGESGPGLTKDVVAEERADAAAYQRTSRRSMTPSTTCRERSRSYSCSRSDLHSS